MPLHPSQKDSPNIQSRSFNFALRIIKISQKFDSIPGTSGALSNQLLRSGTSIGANVEEAQAAQRKPDFTSKISIACKEARETNYWLRLLKNSSIVPEQKLTNLLSEANQIVAILTKIVKTSRENP